MPDKKEEAKNEVSAEVKGAEVKSKSQQKREAATSAANSKKNNTPKGATPRKGVSKSRPERAAAPKSQTEVSEEPAMATVLTAWDINVRFGKKDYVGSRFTMSPEEASSFRVYLVDRFGKGVLK
jgi:hypothetical protein